MRSLTPIVLTAMTVTVVVDIVAGEIIHVPQTRYAISACNSNVTYDRVLLKRITLLSKYIFTGKVYSASSINGTRMYRVNIRRVLKGDLNDIGVVVKFGTAKSLRFSDAAVFVESSKVIECALRVRTYGIFLTERRRGAGSLWLSLVVEPLVLTLGSIGVIEAAVKGSTKVNVRTPPKVEMAKSDSYILESVTKSIKLGTITKS